MKVFAQGATDLGRKRSVNEDNFRICDTVKLYLVADGMGGHIAGDIASKLAVDIVSESVRREIKRCEEDLSHSIHPGQILEKSIQLANKTILETTMKRSDLEGMGTTIVAALIKGHTLHIANVGDSRIYRFRKGKSFLLTSDHSWVNIQVRLGNMTEEEARYHPMRNVITRALGTQKSVEVDVMAHLIKQGDIFLLCSDGLTNLVVDAELAGVISKNETNLESGIRKLIDLANERGGDDNITIVLIQAGQLSADDDLSEDAAAISEDADSDQDTEIISKEAMAKRIRHLRFPKHPP